MSRRGTNIRKRADGRWEGRYYIVDTAGSKKCKSVYGHSYKEVTERLLSAKAASLNQTIAPKQSAITVKEVAEKWLKSIASSRKCSTIQKYSTIYNKYIKPNWGESVIDQLNHNEILKLLPETAGESVTKSILCIFNSILAYGAATYGTVEIHLSYRAKRSSVTSSNNINTINTTDQQKLTEYLLTELDIYKLGILLCLFMGLRLGEICALKWEDIDMISRTLHVNRTVQRLPVDTVHTSGSSQNNHTATRKTSLYIDSPKTSNSLREIPIPDFIYDKLSDYYNTSIKGDSYFLKKNQPMDPRTYQNRFHIYIREAGIGNTHFHALRHTFATNCISSGADAKSVSIAFFSIGFLLEGKNKIFIFLSIVATLFHSSGIICFAILGMYKFLKMNNNKSDVKQLVRALFFIAALVVVLMMGDYVIRFLVEQRILRRNYLNYLSGGDYATARVAFSTLVAPAIYLAISLSGYNRIKKMSIDSLFFLMAALIYFFAAFGSGISTYISRFSYYFLPLVLIMLLMICKSYRKQNRPIMYAIITVFVFGVWYYEIVYRGYGETVPYLFYWQ